MALDRRLLLTGIGLLLVVAADGVYILSGSVTWPWGWVVFFSWPFLTVFTCHVLIRAVFGPYRAEPEGPG